MELPIVQVKNLPYDASTASFFELFGKYGTVNQLRISDGSAPAGTCFIVYTNMDDASKAAKELSGINFQNRYLVSGLYHVDKNVGEAVSLEQRKQALEELKKQHNIE
ncbi:hypothetical protein FT663_01216 [Candidozyma haemuli var. vulneris]|uniref:RRM domain-containing protein n=1 Tax=Candidozyma haemuli TaxID=45357 RepID=A0A2V1AXG6_9ASCO|nr:hypothetical protein CXQ85_005081 [[Candida] haemuloni]KAF3992265.1 hypothetical protein FT662_01282 [[Candida] haemuloni var. vulneris]KAF3994638.1 hypothetical protein FT663_01216 [[Candida] haemuloni var. vulneris]PVH22512.1 hypothetical protein CXQ85_005081 [[Candida] haemuloni]